MDPLYIVRKQVAAHVGESGKHDADPEVLEAINEARRILYPIGDWQDTVEPTCLNVCCNTVTLPSWGETIRKAWFGTEVIEIDNQWFASMEASTFRRCCYSEVTGNLVDLGKRFAVFRPYDKNFRIKVMGTDNRDKGVELTFHSRSEYGETLLLTRILGNAWQPVIADPANDKWINAITAVNKPVTFGDVRVYIWDPVRQVEYLAGVYEPHDVNPQLRRYAVRASGRYQIFAMVKKRFADLIDDRQLVDIHTDALIHVLHGITSRKNRDQNSYGVSIAAAKNFLDKEIQNNRPTQASRLKIDMENSATNLGF